MYHKLSKNSHPLSPPHYHFYYTTWEKAESRRRPYLEYPAPKKVNTTSSTRDLIKTFISEIENAPITRTILYSNIPLSEWNERHHRKTPLQLFSHQLTFKRTHDDAEMEKIQLTRLFGRNRTFKTVTFNAKLKTNFANYERNGLTYACNGARLSYCKLIRVYTKAGKNSTVRT